MGTVVVGVAGGTGSGKTTIVQRIMETLGTEQVTVIQHDWYYRDRSYMPLNERETVNYDHPDALESELLASHLELFRSRQPVQVPVYDFVTHTRRPFTHTVCPHPVIIVEGILILAVDALRRLMDIRIFVDTDADTRLIRRLQRDTMDRGRSVESIVRQYLETVKPMHLEFVEPSKRYADVIIPEGGYNTVAVDMLSTKIKAIIGEQRSP